MAKIPQPAYRLVKRQGHFEIRAYEPMVLAEIQVPGFRRDATNDGFRALASYILGANNKNERIAMTIPVTTQPSDDVGGQKGWTVRFIMPPGSTLGDLPKPDDKNISLIETDVARAAVIRFSGRTTDSSLKKNSLALKNWIKEEHLLPTAPATFAFYDPPFTLPFLRRNEVLVGIEY